MALTLERIEALAPDQPSLAAARKLLKFSSWPALAEGDGLGWGECQGSGSTPYRVVVSEADAGYKCTCPSRKFPCKHSLALMWMRVEKSAAFVAAQVPEWVKDWLSRRRGSSGAPTKTEEEGQPKTRPSIRLTEIPEATEKADPKAEQRAAAARLNLKALMLEPEFLSTLEADVHLVADLISLRAAIPGKTLETARQVVRKVVDDLMRRLEHDTRETLRGALNRSQRTRRPRHADID